MPIIVHLMTIMKMSENKYKEPSRWGKLRRREGLEGQMRRNT